MKAARPLALLPLLAASRPAAPFAQPGRLDVGSFTLLINGQRAGREQFSVQRVQSPDGGTLEVRSESAIGDRRVAMRLETDSAGTPVRYSVEARQGADVTLRLWQKLKPRLSPDAVTTVYERVDRPLVPVIAAMEREGVKVDREHLARLSSEFAHQMGALEVELHDMAGQPFAIGSPQQLGAILFDKLGYKGGRKGKSGQYSTDQSVLEGLAAAKRAKAAGCSALVLTLALASRPTPTPRCRR